MARRKEPIKIETKVAVMRGGRIVQVVKTWQFYSVFGFCRDFGETIEEAYKVACWCRDDAKVGDKYQAEKYRIDIEERVEYL